ncbi:hypothetical protein LOD99_11161 [Oopsacas minuta]|uniref:Uncharacterized protein n=1 Tax=Oopsacas minuta TaxID=111878 RepID=A0AAV7K845_9METZ|nr:hypothetical protein LOD99_11161 [Oopsacas minuta]
MESKLDLLSSDEDIIYPGELTDKLTSIQDENKEEIELQNKEQSHDMTMSLPVVPMRTLLQAYTQKKIFANNGEDTDNIRELINSGDNSDSEEVEDKREMDKVLEICIKLEDLVETQSRKISELTTEVQKLKNWKEQQGRLQATLVVQKYWRQYTSNNVKPKEQTNLNGKVMEKLKELNNEVILIKDFLKNLLEQSIKEGNTSPSLDTSNNSTGCQGVEGYRVHVPIPVKIEYILIFIKVKIWITKTSRLADNGIFCNNQLFASKVFFNFALPIPYSLGSQEKDLSDN